MGSSHSTRPLPFDANIQTSDGRKFKIPNYSLVDHIILLRQVIAHSEMMQGERLNRFIEEYCRRMSQQEMTTKTSVTNRMDWTCSSTSSISCL
jgi:hypothetical protein